MAGCVRLWRGMLSKEPVNSISMFGALNLGECFALSLLASEWLVHDLFRTYLQTVVGPRRIVGALLSQTLGSDYLRQAERISSLQVSHQASQVSDL
jgi:hypothetical protein